MRQRWQSPATPRTESGPPDGQSERSVVVSHGLTLLA